MRDYNLVLVTDGSALTYANCGGWGYVLLTETEEIEHSGSRWYYGSNRMELWAVLEGLSRLPRVSQITVYTDSHYVINGCQNRKHAGEMLWDELYLLLDIHDVTFIKVSKKHPHPKHIRAHHLAREAVFAEVGVAKCQQSVLFVAAS